MLAVACGPTPSAPSPPPAPAITFVARCARISVWHLHLNGEVVGRTGLYGLGGGLFPDSLVIPNDSGPLYFQWRELDPFSGWGVGNSGAGTTDSAGILRLEVRCVEVIPPRPRWQRPESPPVRVHAGHAPTVAGAHHWSVTVTSRRAA